MTVDTCGGGDGRLLQGQRAGGKKLPGERGAVLQRPRHAGQSRSSELWYTERADADGLALLAEPGDRVLSLKVWAMGTAGMADKGN